MVAVVGGLKTDRRTAVGSLAQEAAAPVEGPARAMANSYPRSGEERQ